MKNIFVSTLESITAREICSVQTTLLWLSNQSDTNDSIFATTVSIIGVRIFQYLRIVYCAAQSNALKSSSTRMSSLIRNFQTRWFSREIFIELFFGATARLRAIHEFTYLINAAVWRKKSSHDKTIIQSHETYVHIRMRVCVGEQIFNLTQFRLAINIIMVHWSLRFRNWLQRFYG